jgi:soluble lytic murein transglycosylase-like protein
MDTASRSVRWPRRGAALWLASAAALAAAQPSRSVGLDGTAPLCAKARSGQAEAQFQLAWVYAQAPAGQRRHDWAAYLLHSAAAKGHVGAQRTLQTTSWPQPLAPDCLNVKASNAGAPAHHALVAVEAPPRIEYLVRLLSPRYRVPPRLALAIIDVESRFDPKAVSAKNAQGLMQLIPETAQRFGVRDPFDQRDNIQGGLAYLRWLSAYFEGNVTLVAAAYNAGEGAVEKHLGVPPFAETQDYVRKVLARSGPGNLPFDPKITPPSPKIELLRKTTLARE